MSKLTNIVSEKLSQDGISVININSHNYATSKAEYTNTQLDLPGVRSLLLYPQTCSCLAEGFCLPKALSESTNQVLAFSSFSVTLLGLNVYYLIIHGIKHLAINSFCQVIMFPLVTQCRAKEKPTLYVLFSVWLMQVYLITPDTINPKKEPTSPSRRINSFLL